MPDPRGVARTDDEARSLVYQLLGVKGVRAPWVWTPAQWGVALLTFGLAIAILRSIQPPGTVLWVAAAAAAAYLVGGPLTKRATRPDTGVIHHAITVVVETLGPRAPRRTSTTTALSADLLVQPRSRRKAPK